MKTEVMLYPQPRPRAVLAIFAALAAGSATAEIIVALTRGQEIAVFASVARNGFIWLLFGALSFGAVYTARRFPLERARLLQNLPAHLATYVSISFSHTLLYSTFMRVILRQDASGGRPDLPAELLGNLRGDVFIYGMMVGAYYLYAFARRPPRVITAPATSLATDSPAPIRRIPLKEDGRVAFIDTVDVESIEADGDYVKLSGRFGTRTLRQSLSALEQQLDPAQFARIHRSTIVSLSSIKELQPWFHGEFVAIMNSGAKLKVSRTHRAALTEALRL